MQRRALRLREILARATAECGGLLNGVDKFFEMGAGRRVAKHFGGGGGGKLLSALQRSDHTEDTP